MKFGGTSVAGSSLPLISGNTTGTLKSEKQMIVGQTDSLNSVISKQDLVSSIIPVDIVEFSETAEEKIMRLKSSEGAYLNQQSASIKATYSSESKSLVIFGINIEDSNYFEKASSQILASSLLKSEVALQSKQRSDNVEHILDATY